ncbi:hypothetical protein BJ742DRAFT_28202 [Cladochytrium replicatum]|nr:hypothetical protein BJ742DRAFT_28202 [Cladochytrium replicatum]
MQDVHPPWSVETSFSAVRQFNHILYTSLRIRTRSLPSTILRYAILPVAFVVLFRAILVRPTAPNSETFWEDRLPLLRDACSRGLEATCIHLGMFYADELILAAPFNGSSTALIDQFAAVVESIEPGLTFKRFTDEDEMMSLAQRSEAFCVGILVGVLDSGGVAYSLVGRHSVLVQYGAVAQSYFDNFILNGFRSDSTLPLFAPPRPSIAFPDIVGLGRAPMPFTERTLMIVYSLITSFFLLPICIVLFTGFCNHVVQERTSHLRLVMDVMGLSSPVHMLALVVAYIPMSFVSAFVVTATEYALDNFNTSSPLVIFAIIFAGFASHLPFACLASIRLSDSGGPAAIATVLFLLCGLSVKDVVASGEEYGLGFLINVFPPATLARVYGVIIQRELLSHGVTIDEPIVITALIRLGIQSVVFMVLALYFDAVLPGGNYASKRHWLFPLQREYWRPPLYENLDLSKQRIVLNNLKKVFWVIPRNDDRERVPIRALDGLSLEFEGGQTVALVGHNGAGKSTLLSILCGSQRLTEGDIRIGPLSVRNALQFARIHRELGFCPQNHALEDNLSAYEHLQLFCAIRGVKVTNTDTGESVSCDEYIKYVLSRLEMRHKMYAPVRTYSGGMKRKINLAIAVIGAPKILVLDECTAGLDIIARQKVWRMLREIKQDRVIILSTHDMEEADAVGDVVVVMRRGKVKIMGTPVSLKTEYGPGYRITVRKGFAPSAPGSRISSPTIFDSEGVKRIIDDYFADVAMVKETEDAAIYMVPRESVARSTDGRVGLCLGELYRHRVALGVADFDVAMGTMQDVFLANVEKLGGDEVIVNKVVNRR